MDKFPNNSESSHENMPIDIKSGAVNIISEKAGLKHKHKMHVKVFRNAYEHHAQIYYDENCNYMFGFISLKKCQIEADKSLRRINVVSRCGQTTSSTGLSFEFDDEEALQEWTEALTPGEELSVGSEFSPQISPYQNRRN